MPSMLSAMVMAKVWPEVTAVGSVTGSGEAPSVTSSGAVVGGLDGEPVEVTRTEPAGPKSEYIKCISIIIEEGGNN